MSQVVAGDFVVGRKVRVPRLGGHLKKASQRDDARNGRLQAYDPSSGTYAVQMDSGALEHGITRGDIVVPFDLKAIIDPGMGIGLAN